LAVFNIIFEPMGRKAQCPDSTSILDCARQAGVGINNVCGGMGTCHTCKPRLVSGSASDNTESEEEAYSPAELQKGWRLACQVYPRSDCKFQVPAESMTLLQRLQVEGAEIPVAADPPVKAFDITVSTPTLKDLEADADRTIRSLREQHSVSCDKFDIALLRDFSDMQRQYKGQFRVVVRDREVIAAGAKQSKLLGLAVDVGSTKIAVYILDLETGKTLASEGVMNPQVDYGDDIVSRMTNAIKTPAVRGILQQSVIQAINDTVHKLCDSIKLNQEQIAEAVIVGNTAMHHFLLGLPVHQLAIAPYVAAVSMPLDVKARDIGIKIAAGAYVHLLPNIAGFVGADHISALLGVEALELDVPAIVLDIGTNTEISFHNKGKITAVSCASGPAFEGAHIKSGMRAASGAIERVQILDQKIKYQTVGNSAAIGICGSGLLDVVAQFYLSGIIDKSGRLNKDHARVSINDGVAEFLMVDGGETGNGQPIIISQRDIRELQLAKAAIRSGIEVILKHNDMKYGAVEKVIIAGAFGTYINVESAIAIGMLPPLPLDRFSQVGNAAGTGARLALVSRAKRAQELELLKRANYIELAGAPDFMKIYMECNYIGKYIINNNHREEIV
jgi:uncharacterized 2Fe-2S/4Fe-4S cluster protein (DUF4445 family)